MDYMGHTFLIAEQLIKTMLLDYQLLTVVILVSIFGLMLVAVVKELIRHGVVLVLVLIRAERYCNFIIMIDTSSNIHDMNDSRYLIH